MYMPRKLRVPKLFTGLLAVELLFTIAVLALFGIASPNLYRTDLWQDGADNGFNSAPNQGIYAAANYQPYTTPRVWSQFTTDWNLVISVLSMFIMLVKAPLFFLGLFYPPFSVLVHTGLCAVYIVSAIFQTDKDTSDPTRLQNGPPWYITKSCSVASNPKNVGYCQQAKASFACTVIMIVLFFTYLVQAVISCFFTKAEREERRRREEEEDQEYDINDLKSPGILLSDTRSATAVTGAGALPPVTPRTQAFNTLGGNEPSAAESEIYFPPPPKAAKKK